MTAYLDTCLVSALVKGDIPQSELDALKDLLVRFKRGEVSLCCSTAVRDELNEIPEAYRRPHLEMLQIFASVPAVEPGALTVLGLAGIPMTNPYHVEWEDLRTLLTDEEDARHVFIASTNRIRHLITVDGRTLLRHKGQVERLCGVRLVWPTEFLNVAGLV
jgi:hypothetical protein